MSVPPAVFEPTTNRLIPTLSGTLPSGLFLQTKQARANETRGFPRLDFAFSPHSTCSVGRSFASHLNPGAVLSRKFPGDLIDTVMTGGAMFEVVGMPNVEAALGIL
jgi:hypothetical protein